MACTSAIARAGQDYGLGDFGGERVQCFATRRSPAEPGRVEIDAARSLAFSARTINDGQATNYCPTLGLRPGRVTAKPAQATRAVIKSGPTTTM